MSAWMVMASIGVNFWMITATRSECIYSSYSKNVNMMFNALISIQSHLIKCLGNSPASKTHGPPICKNRPVPMLIAQPNRPQSKAPKKPMDFNSNSLLQWGSQECLAVMDMYSCDSRYSLGNLEGTAIPSEPDFGLSWSPSCVVAAEWGS